MKTTGNVRQTRGKSDKNKAFFALTLTNPKTPLMDNQCHNYEYLLSLFTTSDFIAAYFWVFLHYVLYLITESMLCLVINEEYPISLS